MGEQVDPRDLLDLFGGGVEAESAGDAGVGAEDPYGAERGDGPLDQCADGLGAGHIAGYRQTVDALRHLLCPWAVTIGHDDVGTLGGEAFGQGPADAVPAARHDDALSLKSVTGGHPSLACAGSRERCPSCRRVARRGDSGFPSMPVGPMANGTHLRRSGRTELSQHS